MNKLSLLLICIIIISCQSSKLTTELDDGAPSWVKEYPVSDSHYIGIGIADRNSHPQDYIQVAQQNALQNLSSQIKVNISSQSVFLQMDREYSYEEAIQIYLNPTNDQYTTYIQIGIILLLLLVLFFAEKKWKIFSRFI